MRSMLKKITNKIFYIILHIKSSESHVSFTTKQHLNLGGKYSSEVLDLYSEFMK